MNKLNNTYICIHRKHWHILLYICIYVHALMYVFLDVLLRIFFIFEISLSVFKCVVTGSWGNTFVSASKIGSIYIYKKVYIFICKMYVYKYLTTSRRRVTTMTSILNLWGVHCFWTLKINLLFKSHQKIYMFLYVLGKHLFCWSVKFTI